MRKNLGLIVLAFFFALPVFAQNKNETNFELITENRSLQAFDGIHVTGRFKVVLVPGETQTVSVTVPDKFLETVETTVDNGVLYINMVDLKKGQDVGVFENLKTKYNDYLLRQPIEIKIGMAGLKNITARGASRIENEGTLKTDKLMLDISGASKAELKIDAQTFDAYLSEAVKVDVTGNAGQLALKANGACAFNGADLHSKDAKVELNGASRAEIHATESFDANLSGATKVVCTGSPKNIKQYASRGSSITVK